MASGWDIFLYEYIYIVVCVRFLDQFLILTHDVSTCDTFWLCLLPVMWSVLRLRSTKEVVSILMPPGIISY
jgi:hypothetical protein